MGWTGIVFETSEKIIIILERKIGENKVNKIIESEVSEKYAGNFGKLHVCFNCKFAWL